MQNRSARDSVVVDTRSSKTARLHPVAVSAVRLEDGFWARWQEINRTVALAHMHRQLEETGAIDNFRAVAGRKSAESLGPVFRDSDVYKWLEAASWQLAADFDPDLDRRLDAVIDDVAAAQESDGYLNTYFVDEHRSERWTNLTDQHELYCAGHLIQAAVAHTRATGKTSLLDVATRFADCIDRTFGPGKRQGTSGHPEIETALVELARVTGRTEYIDLVKFFVEERGREPRRIGGRAYHLDHKPFRELKEITGHAVRALYLAAGATDLYCETRDKPLLEAVNRLWDNTADSKMYVTGGLGSEWHGEAFGDPWHLPNRTAYAETCAAIAGVMWAWRLLLLRADARYADVIERILYNGFLSGISSDGTRYFYQNPLSDRGHHRRREWFGCACCPPNIARTLASLGGYFYSVSKQGIWVHLYDSGIVDAELPDGTHVRLTQKTSYPWGNTVQIGIAAGGSYDVHLRIPAWSRKTEIRLNGQPLPSRPRAGRYYRIRRNWAPGETVTLVFDDAPQLLQSHPRVAENTGRVALQHGPVIYCFEQVDNPDVPILDAELAPVPDPAVAGNAVGLDGIPTLSVQARVRDYKGWDGRLYRPASSRRTAVARECSLTAVPYFAWANREPGPMQVWIPWPKAR